MQIQNARRGFTLIELLVVIAIIAILAAILFPVFGAAKERGQMTRCLSNLKQIYGGLLFYADDYNTYYPKQGGWSDFADRLYPKYIKSPYVFDDPAVRLTVRDGWGYKVTGRSDVDQDYYYMGFFDGTVPIGEGWPPAKARHSTRAESGLVLVQCAQWPHMVKRGKIYGAANSLMTDGHCRTILLSQWQTKSNPIDMRW